MSEVILLLAGWLAGVTIWLVLLARRIHEELQERPANIEVTQVTYIPGLHLKQPILVTVAEYADEYVITWAEVSLYGSGATFHDALAMFQREVVSLVRDWREGQILPDAPLSKVLQTYFEGGEA